MNYSNHSDQHGGHHHHDNEMPITFWIFLLVETILTILGNSILCWLFLGNKKLRTRQNYFIVSLSISDLLVGLSIVPCEYCRYLYDPNNPNRECPIFCGSVISFNMIASIINLVLISTDRYLSVKRPYYYMKTFTNSRAVWMIVISWIITLLLSVTPISWTLLSLEEIINNKTEELINIIYSKTLCSLTMVAAAILAYFYFKIVETIKQKTKQSKSQSKSSYPAGIWVCILSAIIFFTSWLPYCIIEILLQYDVRVPLSVMDAAYFVLMLSPSLDPVIYAYYRRDFRQSLYARRRDSVLFTQALSLIGPLRFSDDLKSKTTETVDMTVQNGHAGANMLEHNGLRLLNDIAGKNDDNDNNNNIKS